MVQRDEAHVMTGKPVIQIVALVAVIAEGAGEVFYDNTVDAAPFNVGQHPLKILPLVIRCAGNPIIHILVNNNVLVAVVEAGDMFLNDFSLIGYALALVKASRVLLGKPDVNCNPPYFEPLYSTLDHYTALARHVNLLPYHITPILYHPGGGHTMLSRLCRWR